MTVVLLLDDSHKGSSRTTPATILPNWLQLRYNLRSHDNREAIQILEVQSHAAGFLQSSVWLENHFLSHQVLHLLSKTDDLTLCQIYTLCTARRGPKEQGKSINTNCWKTKKNRQMSFQQQSIWERSHLRKTRVEQESFYNHCLQVLLWLNLGSKRKRQQPLKWWEELPHLLLIIYSGSGDWKFNLKWSILLNRGEKYLQLSLNSMLAGRVNSAFSAPSWDLIKTKESSEERRNALSTEQRGSKGHKEH